MKTIIFDLKNTLVGDGGSLMPTTSKLLATLTADSSVKLVLYSMNETWTYDVLLRNQSVFATFDAILLVNKKKPEDLNVFGKDARNCLVVGDSVEEELAFAKNLGITCVRVDSDVLPAQQIVDWLEASK